VHKVPRPQLVQPGGQLLHQRARLRLRHAAALPNEGRQVAARAVLHDEVDAPILLRARGQQRELQRARLAGSRGRTGATGGRASQHRSHGSGAAGEAVPHGGAAQGARRGRARARLHHLQQLDDVLVRNLLEDGDLPRQALRAAAPRVRAAGGVEARGAAGPARARACMSFLLVTSLISLMATTSPVTRCCAFHTTAKEPAPTWCLSTHRSPTSLASPSMAAPAPGTRGASPHSPQAAAGYIREA